MESNNYHISVTEIGEYIRHQSCQRRFKLGFNKHTEAKKIPFYNRLFNPIDPILQEAGKTREGEWEQSLKIQGYKDLTHYKGDSTSFEDFRNSLQELNPYQNFYGREVEISGKIGAFIINGRIDFIVGTKINNKINIRLVECKASRRDKTYHRIQVGVYHILLSQIIRESDVIIAGEKLFEDNLQCVVARIDDSTNQSQEILKIEPLILEREVLDINRLLSEDGRLTRIINCNIDELDYQINIKCDDCIFNVHCLPETARNRGLQLLGIDASSIRILNANGINTLDELAALDLNTEIAQNIRKNHSFSQHLDLLRTKAAARLKTLPDCPEDPDTFPVTAYTSKWESQLPLYDQNGHNLVRIYLSVDYDYVENRVVALSAHVTDSLNRIKTPYRRPEVIEIDEDGNESDVDGITIIEMVPSAWRGLEDADSGVEQQLIQSFFTKLIEAIADVANRERVSLHFYLWRRGEMKKLMEGCSRTDAYLLERLRHLLGCREGLEQLIFSSLQEEVDNRFALGWTGRGLAVITSLTWFGDYYHWTRMVRGKEVMLNIEFTQDIFDFKTELEFDNNYDWTKQGEGENKHKFEIRSRFEDSLKVPYWYAKWNRLETKEDDDPKTRSAKERYLRAKRPNYIRSYLEARILALRWIEEKVRYKNRDINKPEIEVDILSDFDLNVHNTRRAAINFLRLDHQVRFNDWITKNTAPPINRFSTGFTLPLINIEESDDNIVTAEINLSVLDLTLSELSEICSYEEGSWVRINPCSEDMYRGQTIRQLTQGGFTGIIRRINWNTGEISISSGFIRSTRYILTNIGGQKNYSHATLDESISEIVAGRVDNQLCTTQGIHTNDWFHPITPEIPPLEIISEEEHQVILAALSDFVFNEGFKLQSDQISAIVEGLNTRVQLLLGPPGTGKTETTAISLLMRIITRCSVGDIVLLSGFTHTAIDTLLERIHKRLPELSSHFKSRGFSIPNIIIGKTAFSEEKVPRGIDFISDGLGVRSLNNLRENSVLVIGGTPSSLLKLNNKLSKTVAYSNGFNASLLIVDEASMMVFPHFLSLATLTHCNASIMLAGDHRQLSPIVSQDWEKEDRPPVVLYQPYLSSYDAIHNIFKKRILSRESINRSALKYTFRLPTDIRELIAKVYELEGVHLTGSPQRDIKVPEKFSSDIWDDVWQGESGVFLLLHDEKQSRKSNQIEVEIIRKIIAQKENQIEENSIAVITPHRAQRSLLKDRLREFQDKIFVIDTVEKMQGGERQTIIVSATASDPSAISLSEQFILNLNRANVAFSRAKQRLIVVCSEELINHIPAELEYYDSAFLWKTLRSHCSNLVAVDQLEDTDLSLFTVNKEEI